MTKTELLNRLSELHAWTASEVPENIPQGDMPGDKIQIGEAHLAKAATIFPLLVKEMEVVASEREKIVISVFGGSGVGKSEIASLLAWHLNNSGIGSYVISGDNYPRRIPQNNDAERVSTFRTTGLKGLLESGAYSDCVREKLATLWEKDIDADPAASNEEWLKIYQCCGREALTAYLGTDKEQDYDEINAIIEKFRSGENSVWLKRMGRTENERWYSEIDFSGVNVLILEWTHGNSPALRGIDVPIMLNSTPEETREHRRLRARDGKTDSPFTTMVLEIEQAKLDAAAVRAKIIISKSGEILDPKSFG